MNALEYCFICVFVLLAAHISNATWVCQNNEGSVSGDSVSFSGEWSSHRCLYDYEITIGDYYFEVRVEDSAPDFKVGVTTEQALYKRPFKGFFYGIDLTDGSNVLIKNFGDMVDLSDKFYTVGVIVRINSEKMDLYIIHADFPLGLAFSISTPPIFPLYPAVIVQGKGKATFIRKKFSKKLQLERWTHPIEGSYKFTLLKEGNTKKEIQCSNDTIQLRSLYFGYSADDGEQEVVVSFNDGKPSGVIVKQFGKWEYQKEPNYGVVNGSHKSDCMKFVESVVENVVSFKNRNSKIIVISGNGSGQQWSFEAEKIKGIVPSPVTEDVLRTIV